MTDEGAGLDAFPVVLELPVRWGDMDAFGHVNNTVYFRFFESARVAYLEAIGFLTGPGQGGVGAIVASTSCRFLQPLRYPDTVRVGARSLDLSSDRFTMAYGLVSVRLGRVAATGDAVVVSYDYAAGRSAALPDPVRTRIHRLEAGR